MPKKAKGSLPTIIKPINTSLKTDRKDAMCLSKEKKQIHQKPHFSFTSKFHNSSVCVQTFSRKNLTY